MCSLGSVGSRGSFVRGETHLRVSHGPDTARGNTLTLSSEEKEPRLLRDPDPVTEPPVCRSSSVVDTLHRDHFGRETVYQRFRREWEGIVSVRGKVSWIGGSYGPVGSGTKSLRHTSYGETGTGFDVGQEREGWEGDA